MEILQGKIYRNIPVHYNVRDLFKDVVKKHPKRDAYRWRPLLTDKEPTSITFEGMDQDITALQYALYHPEENRRHIAIIGVNSYHWCIAYNATIFGIGISVPLDPLLTAVEIVNLMKRSESDTLICDAHFIKDLAPYFEEMPFLKHKICMLSEREVGKQKEEILHLMDVHGFVSFESELSRGHELLKKGASIELEELLPDTQAALLFTSGTTSDSKGVELLHYNITSNVAGLQRMLYFPDSFTYLSVLPLHHCLENTCGLHAVLAFGGTICACDGLRYMAQNMQEYKPTLMIGVPALYDSLYKKITLAIKKQNKEKAFNKARKFSKFMRKMGVDMRRKIFKSVLEQLGGNLKHCVSGAAPQRVDVIEFFDELGVNIYQGYGLSECAPVVAGCNTQINPFGTCGHPIGGLTVAIDNDKPGEDGEILVKIGTLPNHKPGWSKDQPITCAPDDLSIVMRGYYNNEEANETVFAVDGWLRTMDIGHIDPVTKGIVLTGRAKSMIVLNSGKKVFPEEIETKLNAVGLIADSLIWGEDMHNNDTALVARLVLDEDILQETMNDLRTQGVSDNEMQEKIEEIIDAEIERINGEMVKFKRIRHFFYSKEDIIKTTTRKIKRQPEIDHIHKFFRSIQVDGLDFNVHNLDDLGFYTFSEEEKAHLKENEKFQ